MKLARIFSGLICLCAILASPPSHAQGHETGNGGDAYVAEFVRIARKIQVYLDKTHAGETYGITAQAFLEKLEGATISAVDEVLYFNNVPKDARNWPDTQTIKISRPRWRNVLENQKDQIVLHEILGLLGKPDQKYEISSYIVLQMDVSLESFGAQAAKNPHDFVEWTHKVDLGLREALNISYQAKTIDEERIILAAAITATLDQGSLKNQKFFAATLNSAMQDADEFENEPRVQVRIYRNYIQFALDDLNNLNLIERSPEDYSQYVRTQFGRGLTFTALSKSNREEKLLLESLIRRGRNTLMISDYNRTNVNACVITQLTRVIELADHFTDIEMVIQSYKTTIQNILSNNFNCN